MMNDDVTRGEVVASFEKNSREEVRISIDDFRGRKIINIRVYYRSESGTWSPGKQGLALSVDRYRDLAEATLRLGEKLQADGLLLSGE
jgi:transcriptional coactivator p15 (PC4)